MKQFFIFILFCVLVPTLGRAQQKIGGPPGPVNPKAILELVSTDRGFLLPRMSTSERDAMSSTGTMPEGLLIFNTDTKCTDYWNGTRWSSLCGVGSGSTAEVASLKCTEEKYSGNNPIMGSPVAGMTIAIDYIDGNGGAYPAKAIQSTGVEGLIANLAAGTLSDDDGSLTFNITGTATSTGIAKFPLTIGNTTCEFEVTVLPPAAISGMTNCGSTVLPSNPLTAGSPVPDGTTILLHYTGGNGGGYNDTYISSAGIAGMVAGTPGGTINNGDGDLELELTGIPAAGPGGLATFTIRFAGNSCQVSVPVAAGGGNISGFSNCPGVPSGTLTQGTSYTSSSNVSIALDYTGGNGEEYAMVGQPSTGVAGLFASLDGGNFANGSGSLVFKITGTPTTSGIARFSISLGGKNCELQINVQEGVMPLPGNMKFLFTTFEHYFVGAYDNNYLPYSAPTGAASLTAVAADGTADKIIDVPYIVGNTGLPLKVPYEVTNAAVSLPAYNRTITIPAIYAEDNIPHDITISWPAQTLQPGKGYLRFWVTPTTDYPVKKLDINSGMGSDYKGHLVAEFIVATNSFGGTGKIQLRLVPVLPDRQVAQTDHRFMYGFISSATGKIWLVNNLGANFANVNHSAFAPIRNVGITDAEDFNAYGSLFQWGRPADGHELINWTSSTAGTPVNNTTTTTKATTDFPGNATFIKPTVAPMDWRSDNNNTRWQGVASATNPCPYGFRVPTVAEMQAELSAYNITNGNSNFASYHKFPYAGYRSGGSGGMFAVGANGNYWTSTVSGIQSKMMSVSPTTVSIGDASRTHGASVRCIRN